MQEQHGTLSEAEFLFHPLPEPQNIAASRSKFKTTLTASLTAS